MAKHWGALRSEWDFFVEQGLGSDLLPVVSNPNAKISKKSSLKSLGKTPSRYDYYNEVVGIPNWTNVRATPEQIRIWANQPDHGISLIARVIKAIDTDVTNARLAARIRETIDDFLLSKGIIEFPIRFRRDSSKFLIAIKVEDAPLDKAVIDVGEHGIIELLSNKQQFIAAGTHPSGARYEWSDLNLGFPELRREELTELWGILKDEYGVKNSISSGLKELTNPFAVIDEPIYNALVEKSMIKSEGSDPGSFNIVCPFAHEHTTEGNDEKDSSTTYFAPHTGGHANASIKCLHAHCADRKTEDFKRAIGLDGVEEFESIEGNIIALPTPASTIAKRKKFAITECFQYKQDFNDVRFLMKGVIPAVSVGTIIGAPGSGKSFSTLDMAACFARGIPWYGRRCSKGRVVYVIAEAERTFKLRIEAYCREHGIESEEDIPIGVIAAKPNLMDKEDVALLIQMIREAYANEDVVAVIFDTYAMCMLGEENSSKDTTQMLRHLHYISQQLECAVLAVHHTGKNAALGARGSSTLLGGVDFEIFVTYDKKTAVRTITSGKFKEGEDNIEIPFKLKRLVLGVNADGDELTSCVVTNVEPEDLLAAATAETPKLRAGEEMTLAVIYEYQRKGTGQWPDLEVLVDIINKKEKKEKDKPRPPSAIKRAIKDMVASKRIITLTKENRVVPVLDEPENDDNAQHEILSVDNSENKSNVTPFPK